METDLNNVFLKWREDRGQKLSPKQKQQLRDAITKGELPDE